LRWLNAQNKGIITPDNSIENLSIKYWLSENPKPRIDFGGCYLIRRLFVALHKPDNKDNDE